ncbi:MAG: CoA transferase [Dehalococcoidia bacterium]|nr:CoA transferase [Dehalococcoidia bacterium]
MVIEHRGLLSGYRVLDLTDEKGHLCGKILGDFGADVIKIEKPGGDPSRNIGPFYKDDPDPGKSLFWFASNTSKRGVTLNIEEPDGQEVLKRLVKTAGFVVESFEPGYMDNLGLGYSELEKIKPDIIVTSITPFGQTGPYSHYQATDLVGVAMGGLVRILGELGRPPVRMSCDPQAYFQASVHAATGSMVAHYHRVLTGEGQHVDVSMQQAVALSTMTTAEVYDLMKVNIVGTGQFFINPRPEPYGLLFLRFIFPCKDGHVVIYYAGGAGGLIQSSQALLDWANEEGMALELKGYDFRQWDGSTIAQDELDQQYKAIMEFLMTKTKDELFEEAIKRGIMLAPCATTEDISRNRHLQARGFWEKVDHPGLGETIAYPGAPVRIEEAPWRIQCRPPLIGEHNEEVYEKELGFSTEQMAILKARNII